MCSEEHAAVGCCYKERPELVGRFCAIPKFYHFAGAELRPDATARVTHAVRADQKFAPRNSVLSADNRFSGFAMRIKEDQCSYTNHQNNVTYYNMINQQKIQNCQLYNKIPLVPLFSTESYQDIVNPTGRVSIAVTGHYMSLHSTET